MMILLESRLRPQWLLAASRAANTIYELRGQLLHEATGISNLIVEGGDCPLMKSGVDRGKGPPPSRLVAIRNRGQAEAGTPPTKISGCNFSCC